VSVEGSYVNDHASFSFLTLSLPHDEYWEREWQCMAFRPPGQRLFSQLVNFMGSTTATVMPEYGNTLASKRVDSCIYIEPENDETLSSEYRAAAERMRKALPQEALNFTNFVPLDAAFC
jgi:hypothetical protein